MKLLNSINQCLEKREKTAFFRFCGKLGKRYVEHRVTRSAAALTYYMLFTVFPLLVFLSSLIGRLNITEEEVLARFSVVFPESVVRLIADYFNHAVRMNHTFYLYAGSVLAVYMLYRSIASLNFAVRAAFDMPQKQSVVRVVITVVSSCVLLVVIFVLLTLTSLTNGVYNYIEKIFEIGPALRIIAKTVRYSAGPILLFLLLWVYYFLISDKNLTFGECIVGAAAAAVVWYVVSVAFSFYFNNFADIGKLYGSLGSIILLLTWIDLSGTIFILGAEVNGTLKELKKM